MRLEQVSFILPAWLDVDVSIDGVCYVSCSLSAYHSVPIDYKPDRRGAAIGRFFSTGKQLIPMQAIRYLSQKFGQGMISSLQFHSINLINFRCFDTRVVLFWPKTREWL
jgi:hypothetical protein